MQELRAVARFDYTVAAHVVHFRAAYLAPGGDTLLDKPDRRIAPRPHDLKDALVLFRHRLADVARPSLIGIDRFRLLQLRPHVEEDEVAALNGRMHICGRAVMRIGA